MSRLTAPTALLLVIVAYGVVPRLAHSDWRQLPNTTPRRPEFASIDAAGFVRSGSRRFDGLNWTTPVGPGITGSDSVGHYLFTDRTGADWFELGFDGYDYAPGPLASLVDGRLIRHPVLGSHENVLLDSVGTVWVLDCEMAHIFEHGVWRDEALPDCMSLPTVSATNTIWARGEDLWSHDGQWKRHNLFGDARDALKSITKYGESGNIILGTQRGGITIYNHEEEVFQDGPSFLQRHAGIHHVATEKDGTIWLSSYNGRDPGMGVVRGDHGLWTRPSLDEIPYVNGNLPFRDFHPLTVDPRGRLWCQGGGSFFVYDGSGVEFLAAAPELSRSMPSNMHRSRDGRLLLVYSEAIIATDGGPPDTLAEIPGNLSGSHQFADAPDELWIASDDSVRIFSIPSKKFTPLFAVPQEANYGPQVLVTRTDTLLAFATQNGGNIMRFSNHKLTTVATTQYSVYAMHEDRNGNAVIVTFEEVVLISSDGGVQQLKPPGRIGSWGGSDTSGNLWYTVDYFGSSRALSWNGSAFSLEGLAQQVMCDAEGTCWARTLNDVARLGHGGSQPIPFPGNMLAAIRNRLWIFSTEGEFLYALSPDTIPPVTVVLGNVPRITSSRSLTVSAAAGYGESEPVTFIATLDSLDSRFYSTSSHTWEGIEDGSHAIYIRCVDAQQNSEAEPLALHFVVDGSAPLGTVRSPAFGAHVRDTVSLVTDVVDAHAMDYRLEISREGTGRWHHVARGKIVDGTVTVRWPTVDYGDGRHVLRFVLRDSLFLEGAVDHGLVIDNSFPRDSATSPQLVRADDGGQVFGDDGLASVIIAPRALPENAVVSIDGSSACNLQTIDAPAIAQCYRISLGGIVPRSPILVGLSFVTEAVSEPTVYYSRDLMQWSPVGGTIDREKDIIWYATRDTGWFTWGPKAEPSPSPPLSLSSDSRAFGLALSRPLAITFQMDRSEAIELGVYTRSGRLARKLIDRQVFGPGAHVVFWDGRDDRGNLGADGLYLVHLVAGRNTRSLPIAVHR